MRRLDGKIAAFANRIECRLPLPLPLPDRTTPPAPASGTEEPSTWQAWFDGSALPNPGRLGLGVVVESPEGLRFEYSVRGQGIGCSNEAELQALCAALAYAYEAGARSLVLRGDSDFAVRHGAGLADTDVARFAPLIGQARAWAERFECLEWCWVPRHRNGEADRLSRRALGLEHKPAPHPGKLARGRRR